MASSYVQGNAVADNAGATSGSISLTSVAAGNLLVASIIFRIVGNDVSAVSASGWTKIQEHVGSPNRVGGSLFYKENVTGGTESFDPSWTGSVEYALAIQEFAGVATASALDGSDENESYVFTNTTSIDVGATTPANADGIAVAFCGSSSANNFAAGTISSSPTYGSVDEDGVTFGNPNIHMASLAYTSAVSQGPAFSTTGSGSWVYGAVACFKSAAGGGGGGTLFRSRTQFGARAGSRLAA